MTPLIFTLLTIIYHHFDSVTIFYSDLYTKNISLLVQKKAETDVTLWICWVSAYLLAIIIQQGRKKKKEENIINYLKMIFPYEIFALITMKKKCYTCECECGV